jgi:hypothetical protein
LTTLTHGGDVAVKRCKVEMAPSSLQAGEVQTRSVLDVMGALLGEVARRRAVRLLVKGVGVRR